MIFEGVIRRKILASVARHVVAMGASALMAYGYLDTDSQADFIAAVVPAVVALGTVLWSILASKRREIAVVTAALQAPAASMTVAEVEARVPRVVSPFAPRPPSASR